MTAMRGLLTRFSLARCERPFEGDRERTPSALSSRQRWIGRWDRAAWCSAASRWSLVVSWRGQTAPHAKWQYEVKPQHASGDALVTISRMW